MNLARDEMFFRMVYLELLKNKKLRTVFRPGNRLYPNPKGYQIGEIVTARVIEVPGNDSSEVIPKFTKDRFRIRISDIAIKPIEKLVEEDFDGSSPDVTNILQLKYHLGLIYNQPAGAFDNQEVTRINFYYID